MRSGTRGTATARAPPVRVPLAQLRASAMPSSVWVGGIRMSTTTASRSGVFSTTARSWPALSTVATTSHPASVSSGPRPSRTIMASSAIAILMAGPPSAVGTRATRRTPRRGCRMPTSTVPPSASILSLSPRSPEPSGSAPPAPLSVTSATTDRAPPHDLTRTSAAGACLAAFAIPSAQKKYSAGLDRRVEPADLHVDVRGRHGCPRPECRSARGEPASVRLSGRTPCASSCSSAGPPRAQSHGCRRARLGVGAGPVVELGQGLGHLVEPRLWTFVEPTRQRRASTSAASTIRRRASASRATRPAPRGASRRSPTVSLTAPRRPGAVRGRRLRWGRGHDARRDVRPR